MRPWKTAFLSISIALIVVLNGCKKDNPIEPAVTDQQAMADLVLGDGLFTQDNSLMSDDPSDPSLLGKTALTIDPKIWGRTIVSFHRTFVFSSVTDTSAEALVINEITGQLWIVPKDSTKSVVVKNYTDSTYRRVLFSVIPGQSRPQTKWRISAISALQGGTPQGAVNMLSITNASFFIGGDTLQITDPLNTFFKIGNSFDHWRLRVMAPSLVDSFKVQVTVRSAFRDTDIVVIHRPLWFGLTFRYYRAPMRLLSSTLVNGYYVRVYEHTWHGAPPGRHNVIISALSKWSVTEEALDSTKIVTAREWGIPYVVQNQ